MNMKWVFNDGGRALAGYKGDARDCVVRSIAIATGKSYREIYDSLNSIRDGLRQTKQVKKSSSRNGVSRRIYERYLQSLGWEFVPTMAIGSGCHTHLRDGELPVKPLIARVSRHMVAVIDGVIHDTYDPSRNGTRCVYGYYQEARP